MAFEKGSTARFAAIVAIVAMLAGYAVSGTLLYYSVIGLDASAFPAGEWIQGRLAGDAQNAVGGMFLGLGFLLLLPVVAFLVVRAHARHRSAGLDPSRRNFLAGSAAGAGAGIAALSAGLLGMLSHALLGVGKKGNGWYTIATQINADNGVVKTHPVWKQGWKGARVESYGRLGRTDWKVSDTVLGAGRLRGDDDVKVVRAALGRA